MEASLRQNPHAGLAAVYPHGRPSGWNCPHFTPIGWMRGTTQAHSIGRKSATEVKPLWEPAGLLKAKNLAAVFASIRLRFRLLATLDCQLSTSLFTEH
jgi:hypothetical protein